jgi:hypothetical protein
MQWLRKIVLAWLTPNLEFTLQRLDGEIAKLKIDAEQAKEIFQKTVYKKDNISGNVKTFDMDTWSKYYSNLYDGVNELDERLERHIRNGKQKVSTAKLQKHTRNSKALRKVNAVGKRNN